MSDNSFAFRRTTDPLIIPVTTTATKYDVPAGYFTTGVGRGTTSFWVVNPNLFWVRLRGSSSRVDQEGVYAPVTATTGWLLAPGFSGAFTTQYPTWMSTLSVTYQGISAGDGTIEISYGAGT